MPKKTKPNPSTPENDPNHSPGKPGPAPTGLKRKIMVPLMLNAYEFEYLRRVSQHQEISMSELIRIRIYHSAWKSVLKELRISQGGNLR